MHINICTYAHTHTYIMYTHKQFTVVYVCLISYTFEIEVFEKYFNLHILLVLCW